MLMMMHIVMLMFHIKFCILAYNFVDVQAVPRLLHPVGICILILLTWKQPGENEHGCF